MEEPVKIEKFETQEEKNNELGLKILRLYQEIDRLKEEVNHWHGKYKELVRLTTKYR